MCGPFIFSYLGGFLTWAYYCIEKTRESLFIINKPDK